MTKIFLSEAKRDAWVEKYITEHEETLVASGGFGKHIFTATVMGRLNFGSFAGRNCGKCKEDTNNGIG